MDEDYGQVVEEYRELIKSLFVLTLDFADRKSNELVKLRTRVEEDKQRRDMKAMQKALENENG